MNLFKLRTFLKTNNINVSKNKDLTNFNTMKIKAISKCFIEVECIEKLSILIKYFYEHNIKYYIIGKCSNILFVKKIIKAPLIKLKFKEKVTFNNGFVMVNGNMSNARFSNILVGNGYSNFEFLSLIPGTVSGSLAMNASCYGNCISDNLMYVEVMDKQGHIKWIDKKDLKFDYRNSCLKDYIILRSIFRLEEKCKENIQSKIKEMYLKKKQTQPLEYPTCGSIFKNGKLKAYEYIRGVNMNSFVHNGAMISNKHSNFIINFNNASGKDVLFIIEKIQKKVYDKYKVHLDLEIVLIRS